MSDRDKAEPAVEKRCREAIADLQEGLVGTTTIKDLANAAERAVTDRSLSGALGRRRQDDRAF